MLTRLVTVWARSLEAAEAEEQVDVEVEVAEVAVVVMQQRLGLPMDGALPMSSFAEQPWSSFSAPAYQPRCSFAVELPSSLPRWAVLAAQRSP